MAGHRIYKASFASVYPYYVAKALKKGRTKAEVDGIIAWLTGYARTRWRPSWPPVPTSRPPSHTRRG